MYCDLFFLLRVCAELRFCRLLKINQNVGITISNLSECVLCIKANAFFIVCYALHILGLLGIASVAFDNFDNIRSL